MEENFYKDEFEVFLKEQADNHRMFPSDSVWRNIFTTLHSDEKWPALTVTAFAIVAAIIGVSVYFSPGPNVFAYQVPVTEKTASSANAKSLLALGSDKTSANWSTANGDVKRDEAKVGNLKDDRSQQAGSKDYLSSLHRDNIAFNQSLTSKTVTSNINTDYSNQIYITEPIIELIRVDEADKNLRTAPVAELETTPEELSDKIVLDQNPAPRTDKAPAIATKNKSKNRFSYEVYITPSASFRRLNEDNQGSIYSPSAGPRAINYVTNVNKIVRHAPGTGVEAGVAFGYDLTKKLKITTGAQFNIRQYSIEAYSAPYEVATIALMSNSGMDSVTRLSTYRTSSGNYLTQISNRYYQISIPVGLQLRVLGSKNVGLNVAGSVQPTYTLNKNAYLLSNDFKNYAQSGAIMRNWNVNTSVEAFLSVRSGTYQWQIGPQFRYQQLPTFSDKYPIKEHLMDYGVKIGVAKSIQ
jgi:hypothetical protein